MKYLVIDVETAGKLNSPLVYDIGFVVMDDGRIIERNSFVIEDVFFARPYAMDTAYYADKLDNYYPKMRMQKSKIVSLRLARYIIRNVMKRYDLHKVYAYNASFDYNALRNSYKEITKKYDDFFPDDTEVGCIWAAACDTICQKEDYKTFARFNNWESNHGNNISTTAEHVYAYLKGKCDFEEAHTGLEDAEIEAEILDYIINHYDTYSDEVNRNCWMKVKNT